MFCVTAAAVGFDVLETANVGAYVASQFALDDEFLDCLAELLLFFGGNFLRLLARVNLQCGKRRERARTADAVNGGEPNLKALLFGYGDSCDTHIKNLKCKIQIAK